MRFYRGLVLLLLALPILSYSQSAGDFRTFQSGTWNDVNTWARFDGSSWINPAPSTPNAASGTITIRNPHTVTLTVGATADQTIVESGATLTVNDGIVLLVPDGSGVDLTNFGTIDMLGEGVLRGAGTLELDGTLRVGSLNGSGAIVPFPSVGNIQTTGRVYNSGSRIVFSGVGPQFIGIGHPTTSGVITEINNSNGVTFDTNRTLGNSGAGAIMLIPGDLILTSGNLNISSTGAVRSLTLNANVIPNSNFITITGNNSDLVVNGSGSFGSFPFPAGSQSFRNFTLNRSGSGTISFGNNLTITGTTTINNGSATFNGSTLLNGAVSLSVGTLVDFSNQSLTFAGNFTTTGGLLSANSSSTLILSGPTALTSSLDFSPIANTLNTLTLNKTNAGTSAVVNTSLTVTSSLNITSGQLSISGGSLVLSSGATINRNSAGSITTSSPSGGPWNVSYTGASLTTGLEIPASGTLQGLAISSNSGAVVTLNQSISITNAFVNSLAGRIFTSGNNSVTTGSFSNAGTFSAPTAAAVSGLTLSGNFSNDGIFNDNGGTLTVNGVVTMSGATIATTNFNNIVINPAQTLNGPSTLNLIGNLTNNGIFNAGTGAVAFVGTVGGMTISGSTNTLFYNLILNKSNAGASLAISSLQTVTNSLTLTAGQLVITGNNLVLNNGSTLARNAGSIATSSPGGGPWNLAYTGGTLTTGLEIPASGNVLSLTLNTSAASTVTLNQNIIIANNYTNSAANRTFTCGTNSFTTGQFSNAGVFNAPGSGATIGIVVSGNFVNDGTFNNNSGVIKIAGNVAMSGASITTTNFFDVTINGGGTLTPASILNIQGNFANGGNFNANSGNVIFSGAIGAKTISGNDAMFFDLTLNKSNAGVSVSTLSSQTVTNSLTLTAGQLSISGSNLSLNSGTLLKRNGGSQIVGSSPGGGPWNLQYTGIFLNSGFEIPPSGNALSLITTMLSGHTVTLTQAIHITNNITINNGSILTAGAHSVSASTLLNSGTFNAPTGAFTLALTSDLTNNGTFNGGSGSSSVGGNLINSLTFNGGSGGLTVTGNLTNTGTFNASSGASSIGGGLINNLTFNGGSGSITVSGDFTNNNTFTRGTGTILFNGTPSHILGSSAPTFNHLVINNAKTLIGPTNLLVAGNFTNNGTFTAGTNAIQFNGTTLQKLLGTTITNFYNIVVNNTFSPYGLSIEANENLIATLTLASNVHVDADGSANNKVFTLLSTADHPVQDAAIATIPGTSSVDGAVTAQRFFGIGDNDDRFISSPLTVATVAQLQDDLSVTGQFTGSSFPCTGCLNNGSSLLFYDETVQGTFQSGYKQTPVPGGANTEVLVPGRGYDAYMWNGVAPTNIDLSAPISQGPLAFTITRTNSVPPQPSADGWNLVGNPYPSAIAWALSPGWSRTKISSTVYVWDRQISAFRVYNDSTSVGNLPGGIISSGQAFWVYAYPGGPSMSINEQAKTSNLPTTSYYRTANAPTITSLKISLTNKSVTDEAFIMIHQDATPNMDRGLDALKLETGKEQLQISPVDEQSRKLAIYALNRNYSKNIPLAITAQMTGTFEMGFTADNGLGDFEGFSLVDRYLGTQTSLASSTSYKFLITENSSTKEDRFFLSKNPDAIKIKSVKLICYPNPASSILTVEINSDHVEAAFFIDQMGKMMSNVPIQSEEGISRGTVNVSSFSPGMYFIKVVTSDASYVEKILIR